MARTSSSGTLKLGPVRRRLHVTWPVGKGVARTSPAYACTAVLRVGRLRAGVSSDPL